MEVCLICCLPGGHLTLLTHRGLKSISEFAKIQDDTDVLLNIQEGGKFHVHKDCQKHSTNKRRIGREKSNKEISSTRGKRSNAVIFCWKSQCFFCEENLS